MYNMDSEDEGEEERRRLDEAERIFYSNTPRPVRESPRRSPVRESPGRRSPVRAGPEVGERIPESDWWIPLSEPEIAEARHLRREGRPLTQLQRRLITGSLVTPVYERCQICFDPTDRISICDNACQPIPMCDACYRPKADCPICRHPTIKETLTKTEFMAKLDPSHQIPVYRGDKKRVAVPPENFRYGQNVAVADSVANDSEAQHMSRQKKQTFDDRERVANDSSKRSRKIKNDAAELVRRLVQMLTAKTPPLQAVEAVAVEILSTGLYRDMDRMETAVLLHLLPASQADLVRALRQHQEGQKIPSEAQVANSIRQRTKGKWSSLGRRMNQTDAAALPIPAAEAALPIPDAEAALPIPETNLSPAAMRQARIDFFSRKKGGKKRNRRTRR
jgi:hypothetical protein